MNAWKNVITDKLQNTSNYIDEINALINSDFNSMVIYCHPDNITPLNEHIKWILKPRFGMSSCYGIGNIINNQYIIHIVVSSEISKDCGLTYTLYTNKIANGKCDECIYHHTKQCPVLIEVYKLIGSQLNRGMYRTNKPDDWSCADFMMS